MRRLVAAVADHAFHGLMRAADELFDAAYGIDTRREQRYGAEAASRTRHGDPATNMPSYYLRLRALRRFLRPGADDSILDLGCGDGRALAVFARYPVRLCRGVEFDAQAAATARSNAARLRRRRAAIEIVEGDAADYPFRDETIVYLFNPFGPATLRAVLVNLRASIARNPRRVRICYYHPKHRDAIEAADGYVRVATLRGFKTDIRIYEAAGPQ